MTVWGLISKKKSFGFYLQQSDESRIFALHKICNIKHVMTVKHYVSVPCRHFLR